jgi:hypothetical protein
MAKNISANSLKNSLQNTLSEVKKMAKESRTNQVTPDGYLPIPVLASDPAVTGSGIYGLYYNSGSGKVRKSYNGSAWADTTI